MARLFDKIDVKASGYITWDDITAFIIQSQHLRDKENRQANENKFHLRVQPLTHKDRITGIEIIQNNSDIVIGSSVKTRSTLDTFIFYRTECFQSGLEI